MSVETSDGLEIIIPTTVRRLKLNGDVRHEVNPAQLHHFRLNLWSDFDNSFGIAAISSVADLGGVERIMPVSCGRHSITEHPDPGEHHRFCSNSIFAFWSNLKRNLLPPQISFDLR